jgi:ribonuclease H / adenosylcobalamin/alpha-ribazole phosphatase
MNPGSDARAASGEGGPPGWGAARGTPTTTLLLRHGQTALSAQRRFAGRGDIPLTDLGLEQAAAAAAALARRGGIDLVVTSPLRRTLETARAVADAAGVPMSVDEALVETDFGSWEGMTFGEVMARWPHEIAAWMADPEVAPPGGESFAEVGVRVNAALDRLLSAAAGQTVVVVSHVTPIKSIVCRALLAPAAALFRFHLDVAALSEAVWFGDGPALLRSLNDTEHLRSR